jgi:hypothetical protein
MEIPDLIWKYWIIYGNSRSDMEIPDLNWKFRIEIGNSGLELESSDLNWKFLITAVSMLRRLDTYALQHIWHKIACEHFDIFTDQWMQIQ